MVSKRRKSNLLSVKLLDKNCTKRKYVTIKGSTMNEIEQEAKRRGLV